MKTLNIYKAALYCLLIVVIFIPDQAAAKPKPVTSDVVGTIFVCGDETEGVVYLDGHSFFAKTTDGNLYSWVQT